MRTVFEHEFMRENVTPAQFLAYLRKMQKIHPGMASDFDLNYFRAGNDLNFNITHEDGSVEKSVSEPYRAQVYIRGTDGSVYNEIWEFDFWDEKTGYGYYYTIQTEADAA